MSDPLDAVFVTGEEAAELKRADTAQKLATYLERMPAELLRLFGEKFQRIDRAELAQLRADALINSNVELLRATIAYQARQLEEAYETAAKIAENCALIGAGTDRRYKVAMDIGSQLRKIAANPAPSAEAQP